jgi:hypothetical protein
MPTEPKTKRVKDRIIEVLKMIAEGTDYWVTPADVLARLVPLEEATDFPLYMVFPSSGGSIEPHTDGAFEMVFNIDITGYVQDEADPGTLVLRCVRDIQLALWNDMKSNLTGSLGDGDLCLGIDFREPPETDNGAFSTAGIGYFSQRVECRVNGTWGEL